MKILFMRNFTIRNKKFVVFLTLAVAMLTIARVNNPPNGRTGAPDDGLCTDCHGAGNDGQDGMITISGLPGSIDPNTSYEITVEVENPNGIGVFGGFQLVVLDGTDDNAGDLTNAAASSTLTLSGGREYWEHNPAKEFGAGTMVSWTATWTSPNGPINELITMYAAGNIANGNGGNSGDLIVTTTASGTLTGQIIALTVNLEDKSDVSCFDFSDGFLSVLAGGGTPPYMYEWSNGETTPMITDLGPGDYELTVSDDDGLMLDTVFTIIEPELLELDIIDLESPLCFGQSNGSAMALAIGGTPEYSYDWSDGASGPINNMLSAGSIFVTVTDNNGCTAEEIIIVPEPEELLGFLVSEEDVSCAGLEDGMAEVSAVGGTEPYLFNWGGGRFGPIQDDLPPGEYTVVITDLNGCEINVIVMIGEPDSLLIELIEQVDNICGNEAEGLIEISVINGQGQVTIQWSNGDNGTIADSLVNGVYSVTVSDENECEITQEFEIGGPDAIDIVLTGTSETGPNEMDGMIDLELTGGTSPFEYEWSTGETTEDISDLGAGTFSVTVTDSLGCIAIDSVTLNGIDCELEAELIITSEILCAGDGTGTICVVVTNYTGELTYDWSNGQNDSCVMDLPPGTYSLTVTDSAGCIIEASGMLSEPDPLEISTMIQHNDCYGDSSGQIIVTVTGGVGPYDVLPDTLLTGLVNGSYTIQVTDANGCSELIFATVNSPDSMYIDVDEVINEQSGMSDGEIYITHNGGEAPFIFEWTDSLGMVISNEEDLIGVSTGEYTLTVTDSLGCETTVTVLVDVVTAITERTRGSFTVFPNPVFNGQLYLEMEEDIDQLQAKVYSTEGSLISKSRLLFIDGTSSLALDLEPGIYILNLSGNEFNAVRTFIVGQ